MTYTDALASQGHVALDLLAALGAGLLAGIERGWQLREEADGARVAGVRTFALLGGLGGLVAIAARLVSPAISAILFSSIVVLLVVVFLRSARQRNSNDATTMVAAFVTLGLGLLAGAGYPAIALAGAAVTALVLASRTQAHGLLRSMSQDEVRAIARYAVIAGAVLPFLPDASYGPYEAWNPFKLWLVVVLVTGFSVLGYIANRVVGQERGTIATALIGGAYSSTAVTAAFSTRLKNGDPGPFATGIALASAVMYLRVALLALVLAPRIAPSIALLLGPAAIAAFVAAGLAWRREADTPSERTELKSRPFELLPALGFLLAVAAASLLVRWAQVEFGQAGGAISLFIAGSFDVDAAMVAYSTLPADSVPLAVAALALSGTVAVNMAFKAGIVFAYAGAFRGRTALVALLASLAVLCAALVYRAVVLFG
ncbi:membrane protein [Novosphingobium marinum]|uniref:Uncharacterized membrane protein (DUF4010 family) n=1 Tax=Novosphingobium marinum TaxID=1514948 RepID=A0A7Y9XSS3_9SPHN|nr:DUF4010 domain-containing protein [Novosphingobium marinum]NYH93865.1 uncharacterized membrane protein (DUF4010 family) [Novosphingobium marinum]GGC17887.1 membrane protein [Novosphingobium marinum]